MISEFYESTGIVTRATTSSATGSDTITTAGSYLGTLRVEDEKEKLFVANNIGKEFDFYTDEDNDIRVGDDLYISSTKYDVLAVSIYHDYQDDTDSYLKARVVKK